MKPQEQIKLSKRDKILLMIYTLAKSQKKGIKFENIVVALFKKYRSEFHLPGYLEYPDSEAVNKAIYSSLRINGLVNYGNKIFTLTDKGLEYAMLLKKRISNIKVSSPFKLIRSSENEILRIKKLDGFVLFSNNKYENINDTDFYSYLGISVKTNSDQILGRVKTMEDVINELKKNKKDKSKNDLLVIKYHGFILKKFEDLLKFYKKI